MESARLRGSGIYFESNVPRIICFYYLVFNTAGPWLITGRYTRYRIYGSYIFVNKYVNAHLEAMMIRRSLKTKDAYTKEK